MKALPVAVYATDANGFITFFNDAAIVLWGRTPVLGKDRWCGSMRLYTPEGAPLALEDCPMALSLRSGEPVLDAEAILERPDGTRIPFRPHPTLIRDEAGRIAGALNVLIDLADRARADSESARLAAIVASSDDAIVSKTLDGTITSWNAGATRIFGYEADEMVGQSILRIIPPELREEEAEIVARLAKGERIEHFDTVRLAKDGRRLNISLTVSPLRDRFGRVVGASKVARDITDRKQSEQLQRLLFDELNHRVKNTLATIQAIASQSLRRAASPQDFVTSFSGRVQALGRAHDLLVRHRMKSADIMAIIRDQVVLGSADGARTTCSGPLLELDAQSAVQLALVLHELATNARKYGALSAPTGRLEITWTIAGAELDLHWRETGGPEVALPDRHGFGSMLIERTLQGSRGSARLAYEPGGVECRIRMTLLDESAKPLELHAAESHVPIESALDVWPAELAGKAILIVEDEPLIAMDIEQHLRSAGCRVVGPAGTLSAAHEIIGKGGFDAALLDANLNGERVDQLASLLAEKQIPFAFASGYGRDSLPGGFSEAAYLSKPFSANQLCAAMARLFPQA
ncbi:MAG: PAS domain S-box protein [Alphaproteobacteria bacterium]|nr:PAS domain S-box protein [Alphaproteobacteria bacterium]